MTKRVEGKVSKFESKQMTSVGLSEAEKLQTTKTLLGQTLFELAYRATN